MKLLALTIGFCAAIVIPVVPVMLLLFGDSNPGVVTLLVLMLTGLLLTITAVGAGVVIAAWPPDMDRDLHRRSLNRLGSLVVTLHAVGFVALVLLVLVGSLPPATGATLFLAVGVLSFASLVTGEQLRRRNSAINVGAAPVPVFSARQVRRKVRTIVVTFIASAGITAVGVAILLQTSDSTRSTAQLVGDYLAIVFGLALISASVACLVVSYPLAVALQNLPSMDAATRRVIAGVVYRGKSIPLDAVQQESARTIAAVAVQQIPFQLWQSITLLAGVTVLNLPRLAEDDGILRLASVTIIICFVLVSVGGSYFSRMQLRNAQRFASAHPVDSR